MNMRRLAFIIAVVMLAGCSGNTLVQKEKQQDFATAMRAFYLWRCGTAVEADYGGDHFATEACHLEDGRTDYVDADAVHLSEEELAAGAANPSKHRDGTGGWHDAGDFGKYTVNAGITVGVLFYAWDHFGDAIKKVPLNLPETAPGMPEFLKEIKWETDFILKMQYPDGSGRVSHKLTRRAFSDFIMPQYDHEPRFFTVWSSAATADFVAMMAMAARYFEPYDSEYAAKCLEAAKTSYAFLKANPENKFFIQGDFSTGAYGTFDPDDRLWAAAEMWETTGSQEALADLEARISALPGTLVADDWDWGDVSNLGVWTYALSEREGRNEELLARVKEAIASDAETIAGRVAADEHGCPLSRFYWGCNGTAARMSVNLHVADIISGEPKYDGTIEEIAEYLIGGDNNYGRSFVTGIGPEPPMHPHDRRSGADGIDAPWPGYLVGGGHSATDWVDLQDDYSRNEIAINWQAGLVYLLAARL